MNRSKTKHLISAALVVFSTLAAGVVRSECIDTGNYCSRDEGKTEKVFDAGGHYQGEINKEGQIFDKDQHYIGRIEPDGRVYDALGHYRSIIKAK